MAGLGWRLASRLIELGHAEQVHRQARRGDWACAREWARFLAEQDRYAEGLAVLAEYAATGWWYAVKAMAELLEQGGRVDEAVSLIRPYATPDRREQLEFFGRLLGRAGRTDEAFALLRPYVEDWFLAAALVEVAGRAGRDEDAARLLVVRIRIEQHWLAWKRGMSVALLAEIRERQGRIEEAIALLHTRFASSVNGRDQLAELLARHDRVAELRVYAGAEPHEDAMRRLAELLDERGDVAGAIAVYREPVNSVRRQVVAAVHLAELLCRHGRGDEATTVLRSLADTHGLEDWIAEMVCTLYADQGRVEEGLAWLDDLKALCGEEEWTFFRMRVTLMAAGRRREEAIEQAQAHSEAGTWYAAMTIAHLQAEAGRVEDALATLEPHMTYGIIRKTSAGYLLDLGRVEEAVTLCQLP